MKNFTLPKLSRKFILKTVLVILVSLISFMAIIRTGIPQSYGLLRASTLTTSTLVLKTLKPPDATTILANYPTFNITTLKYKLRWNFQWSNLECDTFLSNVAKQLKGVYDINHIIDSFTSLSKTESEKHPEIIPKADTMYIGYSYADSEKTLTVWFTKGLTLTEKTIFDSLVEGWSMGWLGVL